MALHYFDKFNNMDFLTKISCSYIDKNKTEIKDELSCAYDLSRTLEQIRPNYSFNESCQGTVPEAIIAFLESDNYEDSVRKAISLGGDSDTLGCMTGGIAQAYYREIPASIIEEVKNRLDSELLEVVEEFNKRYGLS